MASLFLVSDGIIAFFSNPDPAEEAQSAFEEAADQILAYAKDNAPWADRTGDARAGLETEVLVEGGNVILELFHTVDYGLWLEVIQSGRFAIIMPTLEQFAPQAFEAAGARIVGEGGGDL